MDFRRFALEEAEGTILAHGVTVNGRSFKKGRILGAEDIAALTSAGHETVIAARLEADDIPEDEAAETIAKAARGDGVRCAAPFTGRCNLYAEAHGVALIDDSRLDEINLIDESLTIATVAPFELVEPGQMLATIKIIPFLRAEGRHLFGREDRRTRRTTRARRGTQGEAGGSGADPPTEHQGIHPRQVTGDHAKSTRASRLMAGRRSPLRSYGGGRGVRRRRSLGPGLQSHPLVRGLGECRPA